MFLQSRRPHDDLAKLQYVVLSFLLLVAEVGNGFVMVVMMTNQNLGFQNLRTVHTSSTTTVIQHYSVRNIFSESIYDIGVVLSTLIHSISVVEKIHCDVILTTYCQFPIVMVFIHRYKWCIGRRVWDLGKYRYLFQLCYEIKRRRSTSVTDEESFEEEVFWLYGDVLTVVESWLSRFLVFMIESIYWILYQKISIVLNWDKINIIQQKILVFMMRRRSLVRKKVDRSDPLVTKRTWEGKTSLQFSSIYIILSIVVFLLSYVSFVFFLLSI